MKQLIIFTAEPSNFVPKSLKEEAEKLGFEAMILDVTHCVIAEGIDGKNEATQLASQIYICAKDSKGTGEQTGEPGKITPLVVDQDTVVIPRLNEYNLEMKLSMLQRMNDNGARILNSVRSMELCNDKLMSQVTLNTAGIKTPYSFTMQNADDVEKMVGFMEEQKRLKFPVIVKTLRGTHGIGVMKLDSRSSLVSVTQMLLKEGIEFMVQEFLEHDQSARIIMIGDKVLAANLRGQAKDKDEFRTNSHLGSETEPYTPSEDEVKLGKKIVNLFGCNFCAIDYIVIKKGDEKEIIVLEVNGSPGLEAISKNWPDRNLPQDVVKFAMGASDQSDVTVPTEHEPQPEQGLNLEQPVPPEVPANPVEPPPEASSSGDDDQPARIEKTINEIEPIQIHRIIDSVDARIDTGAKTSSMHVDSVDFDDTRAKFKRNDVTYTTSVERIVRIKNVHNGEWTRRPVIKLDVTINGTRLNGVEFTLTNRSNMKYQVLVGRNILELLGVPVLVTPNPDVTNDAQTEDETEIEEE